MFRDSTWIRAIADSLPSPSLMRDWPASPRIGSSLPSAALRSSELYAWPCRGSSLGRGAPSRRHHRNPAEAQRRWRGRETAGLLKPEPRQHRDSVATTDALFAQELERKVSNLLAGLSASSIAPRCSLKPLNPLPAHRSSNPTCLGERIRTLM